VDSDEHLLSFPPAPHTINAEYLHRRAPYSAEFTSILTEIVHNQTDFTVIVLDCVPRELQVPARANPHARAAVSMRSSPTMTCLSLEQDHIAGQVYFVPSIAIAIRGESVNSRVSITTTSIEMGELYYKGQGRTSPWYVRVAGIRGAGAVAVAQRVR
jgi:hypothetical protein